MPKKHTTTAGQRAPYGVAPHATPIHPRGQQYSLRGDAYHILLTVSWPTVLLGTVVLYLFINLIFATLYVLLPHSVANIPYHHFLQYFFFSVQTMSTVGYGEMYPATTAANLVMTLEAIVGALFYALLTGLFFARFSYPTARVLFSNVALITHHDGVPTLMLRIANQRRNNLIQAEVSVTLMRQEESREGGQILRMHDLRLVRSKTPFFSMSWLVLHRIDETSPLYGKDKEGLEACGAQLAVLLSGVDETLNQTVHARAIYPGGSILFNRRFHDMISIGSKGERIVDLDRIHETLPMTDQP